MDVHSTDEVRKGLQSLTPADHAKLMMIARFWVRSRLGGATSELATTPEDLIQDAVVKTLDGRRSWRTGISLLVHLDGVMQSDAGHLAGRYARLPFERLSSDENEGVTASGNQLDEIAARDEMDRVLALFELDQNALDVLRLRATGHEASEIRRRLGIDPKEYDTVTKRIRRRLAAHYSHGDS